MDGCLDLEFVWCLVCLIEFVNVCVIDLCFVGCRFDFAGGMVDCDFFAGTVLLIAWIPS